ncbi:penicillinase repressor [Clostridium sporogenes]|uniref:BlaI/MecI/CopY family transcriptional regulator n=1 Tax=Clostridium botulinum TaxID=1491 RepID=UPI00071769C9|nr:BlaI/MecI/CopY family transcriptional regulator [Clostridium botulinum]KRU26795.1 penicillinase repressor [Clostridium sporogenes]KRU29659.1 penicillinase repressor [Clostridium sporogenes]KRU35424.1 penicillinase repressor [Clostridium sporogenes]KRU49649.1 penicillinase repressor [Clostridium sporogenes]MBZ1328454.1 BlaI/MecI/CopY family transcriptional regulator [Clostridium botulinum]
MVKLPKTEHQVMKYIWEQETDKIASKDVVNYMAEKFKWLKGTTGKVLSRLVDKEFLKSEKEGRNTMYTVLVEKDEYVKYETKEFFSFVHNKSLTSIVSTLGECDDICDEDIKDLEEWIKNR